MATFSKEGVVCSPPVRTFPNGDYFFMEMTRQNRQYQCMLKMAPSGDPDKAFTVLRARGRTIREAQENCYEQAVERCPGLPRPPYPKAR